MKWQVSWPHCCMQHCYWETFNTELSYWSLQMWNMNVCVCVVHLTRSPCWAAPPVQWTLPHPATGRRYTSSSAAPPVLKNTRWTFLKTHDSELINTEINAWLKITDCGLPWAMYRMALATFKRRSRPITSSPSSRRMAWALWWTESSSVHFWSGTAETHQHDLL